MLLQSSDRGELLATLQTFEIRKMDLPVSFEFVSAIEIGVANVASLSGSRSSAVALRIRVYHGIKHSKTSEAKNRTKTQEAIF